MSAKQGHWFAHCCVELKQRVCVLVAMAAWRVVEENTDHTEERPEYHAKELNFILRARKNPSRGSPAWERQARVSWKDFRMSALPTV